MARLDTHVDVFWNDIRKAAKQIHEKRADRIEVVHVKGTAKATIYSMKDVTHTIRIDLRIIS